MFADYHPTLQQLALHFEANVTADDCGTTIVIDVHYPSVTNDVWDEIEGWAVYEGFDKFLIGDKLVLSDCPTGPHGYHDPENTGEYSALEETE